MIHTLEPTQHVLNQVSLKSIKITSFNAVWQATGNDDWLKRNLTSLEKGITYCMTNPKRWSSEYGLAKRTFTIDTWDFTYGQSTENRRIQDSMPIIYGAP